jgi:hypothetical protein
MADHGLASGVQVEQRLEQAVAVDALEQVEELARRARVDLDHARLAARRVERISTLNMPWRKPDALDEARGKRVDALELRRRQRRRVLEALELVGARVHDRVDRAHHRDLPVAREAVCGHLAAAQDLLAHHAERVLGHLRVRAHHVGERLHQAVDDGALEPAEARVAEQVLERVHAPREHRERRLCGLHVERERHRHVLGPAVGAEIAPQQAAARVGLGRDALEGLAGVVLVLDAQHRVERGMRQPRRCATRLARNGPNCSSEVTTASMPRPA